MYARHFFKMLLGLLFMASIGLGGLALVNYYAQQSGGETSTVNTPIQNPVPQNPPPKAYIQKPVAPPTRAQ